MVEINDAYVRERFGAELPQKNVDALRTVMAKYGDNHWWESRDPVEIARYQLFEEVLMVNFSTLHEGVEKLVGRPVYSHEFGLNLEDLRQEAREAIVRIGGKTGPLDDKIASEREARGFKTIFTHAQKHAQKTIVVVPPKPRLISTERIVSKAVFEFFQEDMTIYLEPDAWEKVVGHFKTNRLEIDKHMAIVFRLLPEAPNR